MKLRTQFVILVGGIIAVPFLVSAFMILVQVSIARGREPLPNYDQIRSWLSEHVSRAARDRDSSALEEDRPPGLDVLILGREQVVASTIPELPAGTTEAGASRRGAGGLPVIGSAAGPLPARTGAPHRRA